MTVTFKKDGGDLEILRRLILEDDRKNVERLASQVWRVAGRVETDEALVQSVAEILPEAIKGASERDIKELSRQLSPIIVSGMRREFRNSRDEMVEALYPITGRLVMAAVRNAMAKLAEDINAQFETRLSPKAVWAQIRARATGRPLSDFLIASSLRPVVQRAFILEKQSGAIMRLWRADGETGDEQHNVQLVTGLLAALSNLTEEAYAASGGELRTIDLQGVQVVVSSSARHTLVLEFKGVLSTAEREQIDTSFRDSTTLLTQDDPDAAMQPLVELAQSFEAADGEESKVSVRKLLVASALALCVVLGLIGWSIWSDWSFNRAVSDLEAAVAADKALSGYPVLVTANASRDELIVSGAVPSGTNVDLATARLKAVADSVPLTVRLQAVATEMDREALESALERTTARVGTSLQQLDAGLKSLSTKSEKQTTTQAELARRNDQLIAELRSSLAELKKGLDETRLENQKRAAGLKASIDAAAKNTELKTAVRELEGTVQSQDRQNRDALQAVTSKLDSYLKEARGPLARLEAFVAQRAIQFSSAEAYAEEMGAENTVKSLSSLISETAVSLRIVGHSDRLGTVEANARAGRVRAERVRSELVDLGVPLDRLQVVSRGAAERLSEIDGESSPNRRVHFEIIYPAKP